MFEAFCKEKLGPLALRLAIGIFCVYHGYLKIMAAGGTAWHPGWPVAWQVGLAWAEFTAGVAILLGFWCRSAGLLVLLLLISDVLWNEGWRVLRLPPRTLEMVLLLVLTALALVCVGAGGLSLDGRAAGKAGGKR